MRLYYNKNLIFLTIIIFIVTDQPALVEGVPWGVYSQSVVYMFWGLASETELKHTFVNYTM